MQEPIVKSYRGAQLVAKAGKDLCEGVAWGGRGEGALARVTGISIPDVFEQLRNAVDSPESQELIRQTLIRKHGDFLRAKGIDPGSLSVERIQNGYSSLHRVTHCYSCKSLLDNESDLECSGCKWIICTQCGACGHGHPVYGKNYQSAPRGSEIPSMALRYFSNYADAMELAKKEPGARARRNENGEGWIVELKNSGSEAQPSVPADRLRRPLN